ncbi:hypothetical protein [Microbulbifer taiwanensis]|uniref:Uncharacterized protein n=1 Tax=Microbulbifer taiwanensis TaxID=986746 RepID=A0ABW1YQ73_9GAMM|nr:hypothetical protein [Microbulbifer taiwanensis]
MPEKTNKVSLPEAVNNCTGDAAKVEHPLESLGEIPTTPVWYASNKAKFDQLAKAFKIAESDIKSAELSDKYENGILVPAVNELRYCSYHVIKAISANNAADQRDQLYRGLRHCERASYDALELGLTTYLKKIDEFRAIYRDKNVVMSKVIPGYPEDMREASKAQALLGKNFKDKTEIFEEVREYLSKIKDIYLKFNEAEDDLNTEARQANQSLKYTKLALAATVLIAIAGWTKVFYSPSPQIVPDAVQPANKAKPITTIDEADIGASQPADRAKIDAPTDRTR